MVRLSRRWMKVCKTGSAEGVSGGQVEADGVTGEIDQEP